MTDPRLPRAVLPRRYELELEPDLDAATFVGAVDIAVTVVEPTDEIVLHAVELAITAAGVERAGSGPDGSAPMPIAITDVGLDEESERLTLRLGETLGVGEATIHLEFTGELNDRLRGFYRSTFVDTEGVERAIATTQFESTSARRAFPCWDEPEYKAVFAVTLVVDADLMAISSGAEVERTPLDDGRVAVRFAPTMLLSTYLLAFVVGPLEATDPVDVDGVPLRVVHPIGKGHLTAFALDIATFSLRHFGGYFAIPYPGDKLDLVAVPDFAFGAMENLGCATFREALLLLDPETSTQPEQQSAADVIAHEIAHMWFGDLVTMSWWNGIWLKEAFATFCEMHCTDAWRPEWDRWTDFGLSRTAAFDVDALSSTRAIEFDVTTPDEAEAMYDVLTYEKGAAVVRMLEQYLGADCFRDGIRHYLATFAYRTADTTDLWDAIERTTGEPVREIMDSWIFQGGHPVISVERVDDHTLRLGQAPFGATDDPDRRWSVPLVLATGGDARTTTPTLLRDTTTDVHIDGTLDWVVANAGGSGFHRTRFVGDTGDKVLDSLDHLGAIERYGLVDDAWASLIHGVGTLGELRAVLAAVAATETDLSVWRRMGGVFGELDRHLDGSARADHRRWATGLIGAALDRIGRVRSDDEPPRRNQVRCTLVAAGGLLGDDDLVEQARRRHPAPEDPDANAAYVRIIAAHGDAADFADFAERHRTAATPQDERRYLFALPGFPGADQMASLLAMVADEAVRSQDAAYLLGAAIANRDNGAMAWDWVTEHWALINERYPTNSIPRMISGVAAIGDAGLADRVAAFFAEHPVPQAGKMLDQSLERMALTVDLARRLHSGRPLMRFVPAPRSPAVFGVGTDDAQIVWTRPAGHVRATARGPGGDPLGTARLDAGGRPGALVVDGLPASTRVVMSIELDGTTFERRATTLPHPGGAELARFATMNDLHLGLHTFGLSRRIAEPGDTDCTSMRCATAGFAEAVDWGAQAIFLKGDLVHRGRAVEWEMLAELVAWSPVPVHATFGNHEAAHARYEGSRAAFDMLGAQSDALEVVELPGLRVALVDTSTPDSHAGRIAHVHDDLVSLAGEGRPMLVLHHHQLHATPWPTVYPRGIHGRSVRALTAAIAERNPNVVFASGHTHRHRRRDHGGLTLAELGSSKDYPGTWCGYVVHEGGLTQTVRRIAAPAALEWTERTGRALGGWWSQWSPGRIEDRCFTVRWI